MLRNEINGGVQRLTQHIETKLGMCVGRSQVGLFNARVQKERRKEMFYLTTHSTHMVKDHSDSEKGNPLPPHRKKGRKCVI